MEATEKSTPEQHAMERMQANALRAEALLKQLANAHRLMILCHLVGTERSVSELVGICGLSQSAVSQHLARLKMAGLVAGERRGQTVCYRLSSMEVQALLSVLYLIYCSD